MNEIHQWTGVELIFNPLKNGMARGLSTAIIFDVFVVVFCYAVGRIEGYPFVILSPTDAVFYLAGITIIMFAVSFCIGYFGIAATPNGYVSSVTPYSNLAPRQGDNPLGLPPTWMGGSWQNTAVSDFQSGRLKISPEGLDGIVNINWSRVRKMESLNEVDVRIGFLYFIFGIPIRRAALDLRFHNIEDAHLFVQISDRLRLEST
jgi:hypothetical protein